jgi:ATP-binding cassette, subfamily B, bacterial
MANEASSQGWRLLRRTLRAQRKMLLVGIIVGLMWTFAKLSVPLLVRRAIDRGIDAKTDSLLLWSLVIVGVGVVAGTFTALRRWVAFKESRWTETWLRERLFNHLLRLHIGYHDRSQTGQLMSRASTDLQQIQGFVVMIPLTASNFALVLAVVVILLVLDPTLAVLALLPLPFVNVLAKRFSTRIHPAVMAVQQQMAQVATVVEESVGGVRVVKGFGAEPTQMRKLDAAAAGVRTAAMNSARVRSRNLPLIDLLPSLGLIAVLGVGGHRVINGDMTLGDLVAFNAYVGLLVWPLRTIGMTIAAAQRASAALQRIDEVLSTVPEISDPAEPLELPARTSDTAVGHVEFTNVRFGYGVGDEVDSLVLDGFNLSITAGSSVAIVGATGSGKSTVARVLTRFYDVTSGSIELDGVDVRSLRLSDLRRAVGIVFEDTFLFHDSVAANIAFAEPDAPMERIERAARLAGAHEFVLRMPDGYATVLGERGYSLSGGQRQRIAIARAILSEPRVLVLDDATSAVDPSKEHEIRDALSTVLSGRTTIVIAHRAATIALAERVVLLDEGRVVATGRHEELLATEPRYREVLASWAARDESADTDTDGSGDTDADADADTRRRPASLKTDRPASEAVSR